MTLDDLNKIKDKVRYFEIMKKEYDEVKVILKLYTTATDSSTLIPSEIQGYRINIRIKDLIPPLQTRLDELAKAMSEL